MTRGVSRRSMLRAAAGSIGALCLPGAALGQADRSAPLGFTALSERLYRVSANGSNVIVLRDSAGGATVIDGGAEEQSAALLSLLRNELSVARVHTLLNTCWHPERTGLNAALGAAGTTIIAHENTRLWLSRDVARPWEAQTIGRLPAAGLPAHTFYDALEWQAGEHALRCGYLLQAHTDGDIFIHLPADNILLTGAAISASGWPLLDWWTGGWIGGLIDAFDVLLEVADNETLVVPGAGPPMTRADLLEQRAMYVAIFDQLAALFFAGREFADVLAAAPTRAFDDRYGDPEAFLRLAFRGFGMHFGPDA